MSQFFLDNPFIDETHSDIRFSLTNLLPAGRVKNILKRDDEMLE